MAYYHLGTDEYVTTSPSEEVDPGELSAELAVLATEPFPEPETAPGSPATAKPPAPTEEHIQAIHEALRDHIGKAVLEELDYKIGAAFRGYSRDMRKSAITTASIDLGIGIILTCLGPVGWVIGIIYAAVRTITGGQLSKEAQVIIHSAQQEAQRLEAMWDTKLKMSQQNAIEEEIPMGIKLAMALALGDSIPVPAMEGLGNIAAIMMALAAKKKQAEERDRDASDAKLSPEDLAEVQAKRLEAQAEQQRQLAIATALYFGTSPAAQAQFSKGWRAIVDPEGAKKADQSTVSRATDSTRGAIKKYGYTVAASALNPVHLITEAGKNIAKYGIKEGLRATPDKVAKQGAGVTDAVSGHVVVTKAKEVARQLLDFTNLKIMAQYHKAFAQMNSPDFRAHLRMVIAQSILNNPEILKMFAGILIAKQQVQRPLKIEDVPAIDHSPLPKKPNTGLLVGGGIAAALAAWFMMR